jgi:hypothetical protein
VSTTPSDSILADELKYPPNTPEHLKPYLWKPGIAPNPGGRPKKRPITERYSLVAEAPVPERARKALNRQWGSLGIELQMGATWGDVMAMAAFLEGIKTKNGTLARKDIREALEGKAPQRVEIVNPMEKKTELVVSFKRASVNNPRAEAQDQLEVGIRETTGEVEAAIAGTLETPETEENG